MKKLIIIVITIGLLTNSCDPVTTSHFYIQNNYKKKIRVQYKNYDYEQVKTNEIDTNELYFLFSDGYPSGAKYHVVAITSIKLLDIYDDTIKCTQDTRDPKKWIYTELDELTEEYVLTVDSTFWK